MAYKDLTFLLFAKDMNVKQSFEGVSRSADNMASGVKGALLGMGVAVAAATIAAGAESIKLAANFETATTRIMTDGGGAGESMKALQAAIMKSAGSTGTSLDQATGAMYKLSSAGFTLKNGGAAALQAALEGAKIGGADAVVVADALSTTMTDFGPRAGSAAKVMSELTATVSTGKTNLQDLASALHSVLPNAAAAGLGLNEVLGAVGTMTAEGISADQAAQNLNHSILNLQNPSQVARDAMAGVGLSAIDVAKNLGKRGLAGTYDVLFGAMAKHSKAGLIAVNAFASSAQASASMKTELAKMPPQLRNVAKEFQAGHLTNHQYAMQLKSMPGQVANLGVQFEKNAKRASGFSSALKSGDGPVRTAAGQLEKMVGGQDALSTAMHLTGEHMGAFVKNTKTVGSAAVESGNHVRGWKETQKTLNVELGKAGVAFQIAGVKVGTALMPALKAILPEIPKVADAIAKMSPVFAEIARVVVHVTDNFIYGGHQWVQFFNWAGGAISDRVKVITGAIGWIVDAFKHVVSNAQYGAKQIGDVFTNIVKWADSLRTGIDGALAGAATWLFDVGRNVVQGLINGVSSMVGAVGNAIGSVASGAVNTVKNILGIHSPSTVFHQIGTHVVQGLTNGLLGSASQVQSASDRLASTVMGMFDKGTIGSGTENRALKTIRSGTNALIAEATKRAAIVKQIAGVEKQLTKDLAAQRKARDTTVTDATTKAGDVTQFASAGAMVGGLSALVSQTRRFSNDLKVLVKRGIDQNTFKELVGAGVSGGGLQAADQLVANQGDFNQIVSLQRQLASQASSLGSLAGNFEYAPTVSADRSRLSTLKGAERVETWKMQKTAAGMINAIARETHVHIHIAGTFAGSQTQLAKSVTDAIKQAVKQGHLPKNVLTAL